MILKNLRQMIFDNILKFSKTKLVQFIELDENDTTEKYTEITITSSQKKKKKKKKCR